MSEPAIASPVEPQFDTLEQQREAATMGMWLFLATEVLFFGGMFLGYTVYRISYPQASRKRVGIRSSRLAPLTRRCS